MKKKGLLALGLAATMAFTTACSGGGAESTTAAPAAEEKTESAQAESGEKTEAADAEITEPVTIKFANYALLEQGYEEFWTGVKENPNITVKGTYDSSGKLQTQIEEGARCDIFFSAADKQMDALVDEDLAKKDTVEDILENKVVLIKPKDGETKVIGFENITDAANIALAGDSVPVGQYSREIFDNLGITDEVNKMEINEGKNVSEVLAAVSEGSNEIGIVYDTDAASVADKVDVIAEAPADALKTPVLYPVGLIEDKEASEDDTAAAEAFLEYIKSDDAMKVFEKYGFTAYKADDASETDDKDAEATEEADDTETNAETETTEEAK